MAMRLVVQRVQRAAVRVAGETVGEIGPGLMVLVGVGRESTPGEVRWLAERLSGLRIFADEEGRMNRSLGDVGGAVLLVSQFTLYADVRKGRRPSFNAAAGAELGERLYRLLGEMLAERGVAVSWGVFGAMMEVELVNDGPVTLVMESPCLS
jgi:D-tyrosyl-tRNA(Tyr) deacylase